MSSGAQSKSGKRASDLPAGSCILFIPGKSCVVRKEVSHIANFHQERRIKEQARFRMFCQREVSVQKDS